MFQVAADASANIRLIMSLVQMSQHGDGWQVTPRSAREALKKVEETITGTRVS
jgi:hypothetical protein